MNRGSAAIQRVYCIALMLFSAACSIPDAAPPAPAPHGYVACSTPRPQICTHDYRPVCAQVDTGKRCVTTPCDSTVSETRPNACTACSDPKVMGHRPEACPDSKAR